MHASPPLLAIIAAASLPGSLASTEGFFNLGESSIVMESKEAEVQKAPAAGCYRKTVGEEATFMESTKDLLRQFKDKPAGEHWACLKNKVRAAGEYASLRTRQGISMFGEPKLHSYIKDGAEDGPKKMASTTEI